MAVTNSQIRQAGINPMDYIDPDTYIAPDTVRERFQFEDRRGGRWETDGRGRVRMLNKQAEKADSDPAYYLEVSADFQVALRNHRKAV